MCMVFVNKKKLQEIFKLLMGNVYDEKLNRIHKILHQNKLTLIQVLNF